MLRRRGTPECNQDREPVPVPEREAQSGRLQQGGMASRSRPGKEPGNSLSHGATSRNRALISYREPDRSTEREDTAGRGEDDERRRVPK